MSSDQIHPALLTMTLTELRERVELAERLAIANRFASSALSSGPAASAATASGTTNPAQAAGGGKAQDAAPKAAATPAKATPKAAPAPAAPVKTAEDEDLSAAFGDGGDFGGGGDDDMLAGFVEELTPEQAKAGAIEIAKQVIAKKDKTELASARTIMQKFSVSKVSDIPDDRAIEAYGDFKKAFSSYVTA